MGRKIPGRKHRGVKDPEKQQAERLAKIKDKINSAPLNPEDQQIPSSLTRIIELKNKVKQGLFNKRKKKKSDDADESKLSNKIKGRPYKQIPKFEQMPGESEREFKHRMNIICSNVVKEAAFEDKYNVDVRRNKLGQVEGIEKRSKDELELLVKKLKKESKLKKNKKQKKKDSKDKEEKLRLTKSQKWSRKKAEKKKNKELEKHEDYSFVPQREHVEFGEVAHAPPSLIVPKKSNRRPGAPRPGQKQLLLKSMLTNTESSLNKGNRKQSQNKISTLSKVINKKGKRRDLPFALRRQLDKQQKEIIEAYKMLKTKKVAS